MKNDDIFLKELVTREMEKEAEKIKNKIEKDESLDDIEVPDDFEDRIMEKAQELQKEKETFANLSKADQEALMLGRELQLRREEKETEEFAEELVPDLDHELPAAVGAEEFTETTPNTEAGSSDSTKSKRKVRRWRRKTMVGLAAALVAALGVGVTTFGDKGYVTDRVNQFLGGRKSTNIDTERKNKDIVTSDEEEKVFQKIKDEFGFDAVRLDYKPKEMKIVDSLTDSSYLSADIFYEYNEQILTYSIIPNYRDFSYGYDIEDKIVDEYTKTVNETEIYITEYLIEESGQTEYSAKFEYGDIEYILTGVIEKEEFEKILENLHFF
ncbi:DUF4367 domain-containing protein [Sellimonas caecigallum]|uniref:DUF4367 domain-containing protein n=1 Tax=Sellimonas caecigallum TaxID=2592333 RepID=A0ABS7L6X2_9FIRM|nr:DUF4367 domain-containing protein [Sellimonas caecigallum]MBY0758779.1 DUF4367 domain-containing protein [Sellimonas caecigallum]